MSAADDLDRFIADELEPEPTAVVEDDGVTQRYEVTGLSSADWAARRIAAARRKHAEVTEAAAEQRRIIAAYELESADELASTEAFFGGLLRAFHEQVLAADPKAKTIKLPSRAELRSRTGGRPTVVVSDETALIGWAEANALTVLLRRVVSVDKPLLLAHLVRADDGRLVDPSTGEAAPGVEAQVPGTTFRVVTP